MSDADHLLTAALIEEQATVRLLEIARRAGVSKHKILNDMRRGELVVKRRRCGRRFEFVATPSEADRYLAELCSA